MAADLRDTFGKLAARLPGEANSRPATRLAVLLVALAAIVVSAAADSWRTAALVVVAAAAVRATRIRFASYAGLAVLCATSIIALTGAGPAGDHRPAADDAHGKGQHRGDAPQRDAGKQRRKRDGS